MSVKYHVGDLSFDVKDANALEEALNGFLKSKKVDASIRREEDDVLVDYPSGNDVDAEEDTRILLSFCQDRRFGKAKKVGLELVVKQPWNSEAHRLLAQISMEEGNFDVAIEYAKDALKLDPSNLYALILLGNLLARDKSLNEEGLRYYKRAFELYPESALAINNYAGMLAQTEADSADVAQLFRKAIQLSPDSLNSYYGLASSLIKAHQTREAFDVAHLGLMRGAERPENTAPVRKALMGVLMDAARKLVMKLDLKPIEEKLEEVKEAGGTDVRFVEDKSSQYPARMELAEKYHREYHRLVLNSDKGKEGTAYYQLHEMEKLLMRIAGEKANRPMKFMQTSCGRDLFNEKTREYITDKLRQRIPSGSLDEVIGGLTAGIGGQLMNCPIDVLVMDRNFKNCPELRPAQVVAAYEMASAALQSLQTAVQNGFPKNIVRLSRVLDGVSFIQYRNLLGIDLLEYLQLPDEELDLAGQLYGSCKETLVSFKPGDDCRLVREFLDVLHCSEYFEVLAPQSEFEERRQKESVRTFQDRVKSNADPALNMAITMYMVDAIKRLKAMPAGEVRGIAVEIAILGMHGISPDKRSGYAVKSLGEEDMSGPKTLAYYYISWRIAFPEKVGGLGLPFENEYLQAMSLVEAGM